MNLRWNRADENAPVLILAHGAGAGMDSEFMDKMAGLLCAKGVSVVRFEFDYMQMIRETGKRRPPDRQPKLLNCWSKVIAEVSMNTKGRLFIGGKSMGGRMATLIADTEADVEGVVCFGYPFYATGKQDKPRIDHLREIQSPVLVVQGDRDVMGDKTTVSSYTLSRSVRIHWLEDGSHDLKPRVKSGFTHDEHLELAADQASAFMLKSR